MLILLANKYHFVNQIKLQNPLFFFLFSFFGVSHKNVLFKKLYDDGATSKSGSNSGETRIFGLWCLFVVNNNYFGLKYNEIYFITKFIKTIWVYNLRLGLGAKIKYEIRLILRLNILSHIWLLYLDWIRED